MTTTLTKEQATVEKLLPDIRATHKEFLKSGQATVDLARQIGDMLWKLKECVKKGEWTELVEDRCEFTIRTATTYMKLSGGWELLEKKEAAATTIDGCVKLIGQSKPKTHKGGKRKVVPKPAKSADNGKRGSETESPQPAAAEKPAGPCPHGGEHDYDDEACKRCHDPKPGVTPTEDLPPAAKLFAKIDEHIGKVVRLLDDVNRVAPNETLRKEIMASLEVANEDIRKWKKGAKK